MCVPRSPPPCRRCSPSYSLNISITIIASETFTSLNISITFIASETFTYFSNLIFSYHYDLSLQALGRVKLRCVSRYPKMLLPRPHHAPCLHTRPSPNMLSPWNIKLINFQVSTFSNYCHSTGSLKMKWKYVSLVGIFFVNKLLTYRGMLTYLASPECICSI